MLIFNWLNFLDYIIITLLLPKNQQGVILIDFPEVDVL